MEEQTCFENPLFSSGWFREDILTNPRFSSAYSCYSVEPPKEKQKRVRWTDIDQGEPLEKTFPIKKNYVKNMSIHLTPKPSSLRNHRKRTIQHSLTMDKKRLILPSLCILVYMGLGLMLVSIIINAILFSEDAMITILKLFV